jgi:hypothetical protein
MISTQGARSVCKQSATSGLLLDAERNFRRPRGKVQWTNLPRWRSKFGTPTQYAGFVLRLRDEIEMAFETAE